MEPVLTDLELDLREIKYLLDVLSREPDSMLQKVAIRRVRQMQSNLGVLLREIEGITTEDEKIIEPTEPITEMTEIHTTQIKSWGDRVKPVSDLKSSLTLNDRFFYSRELFNGDMEHMDNILFQISQMESLDNVLSFLESVLNVDDEDETYQGF